MARTPYSLNSYVGGATAAIIAGSGWGAADTTVSITGTNSVWNTLGTTAGFYFSAAYGTATEEKIYVPSGSWFANNGATFVGVTRGIDNTTAVAQASGLLCTPVVTSIDTSEANALVDLELGNMTVRSATGVMVPGEYTVFSGTTAAQTLSLPSGVLINQTNNNVCNYSTQSVIVASGSTAQLNAFNTLGNITMLPNQSYEFTYNNTNNTWYVVDTNNINLTYGSGIAGQNLTPSGVGLIEWANPTGYIMPPTYLSPYKVWTYDPALATATQTVLSGTIYYTSIWVPTAMTLSGISFYTSTFAATATAYLGFFSAATNTQVAICSGVLGGTTGFRTALISGGTYNIPEPGLYYVGLLISGSTSPSFNGLVTPTAAVLNMGIGNQTNALTGLRTGSVAVLGGNRALYTNGTTVSGSISSANTVVPFFALS